MEPPIWRTYRYDLGGELMEQEDRRRGRQQFRYDDEGLLLSRTRRQDTEQFTWDDAGNLCPSGPAARDMRGATVHDDRVKVWQDIRLTYDAFGNVATKKKGSWFEQRFEYDAENRLMAVHSTAHRSNTTTLFSYDAVGRRIGKTVRETQGTEERVAERKPALSGKGCTWCKSSPPAIFAAMYTNRAAIPRWFTSTK